MEKNKVNCTLRKAAAEEEAVRGHLGEPAPNDAVKMLTARSSIQNGEYFKRH